MSPYKMPGFPLAPILYILAGIAILTLAFFQRPIESSIAIATVLIGIPVYWVFKKKYGNEESGNSE
jgi:APA family basic amino acid/polyamine antiporter